MKTILFTFDTDVNRDAFIKASSDLAKIFLNSDNESKKIIGISIKSAIDGIQFDPPIRNKNERQAALYVTGKKMIEGSLSEIEKRFHQEIAAHSGVVEIREFNGGEWKTIQSRKVQKMQN